MRRRRYPLVLVEMPLGGLIALFVIPFWIASMSELEKNMALWIVTGFFFTGVLAEIGGWIDDERYKWQCKRQAQRKQEQQDTRHIAEAS